MHIYDYSIATISSCFHTSSGKKQIFTVNKMCIEFIANEIIG